MTVIRRSSVRLQALREMAEDHSQGKPYRFAAALDPFFAQLLVDGGYAEVRQEGQHPVGGPAHKMYLTTRGLALLRVWEEVVKN